LKNPAAYFKAQEEVDRVVGKGRITPKHLKDLHYLNAVLRETLRLSPTAPAITRGMRRESSDDHTNLGSAHYRIEKDSRVLCLLPKIQRDPKVYGEDANEFKPERMLDENFEKLPKSAWKVSQRHNILCGPLLIQCSPSEQAYELASAELSHGKRP
jgi:cytochrome P450/NADPH-cytochrome P450 reductase